MSAAIQASLNKLNNAVQKLESSVVSFETKQKARPAKARTTAQDDLFSASAGPIPASPAGAPNNLNVRQLAARLDTAIQQVETILKEGRG